MATLNRPIATIEEFSDLVASITSDPSYPGAPAAFALGLATIYEGRLFDIRFPHTNVGENAGSAAVFWQATQQTIEYGDDTVTGEINEDVFGLLSSDEQSDVFSVFRGDGELHANITAVDEIAASLDWSPVQNDRSSSIDGYEFAIVLAWVQDFDAPPANTADAWLRLTLMSELKMQPNSMNLDGIFGLIENVLWTDCGPISPTTSAWQIFKLGAKVTSLDKFPPMLDYVIPSKVRIADGARVRLGAYLSAGTTVMHEGFVNFNAGTLGTSMVEGRISAGVVIGDGTDIGGGASIMGTLSGGGKERVSVGKRSLLGANCGLGIKLGDDCIIEAGLYVTAGDKIYLSNLPESISAQYDDSLEYIKAVELSGVNNLVFRRSSLSGEIEVLTNTKVVELNQALHANSTITPE